MYTLRTYIKEKSLSILRNSRWTNIIWYCVPLLATLTKALRLSSRNNYLIYKGVLNHTLEKLNLYNYYPSEYFDKNHYGIVFSVLIWPFTFLPDVLGALLYQALQLWGLQYVIRKLPMDAFRQNILLFYLIFEAIANGQNLQTNTFIAFVMMGAFVWIENKEEGKAVFVTLLGTFIKIYGIVAAGLFFFVKNKWNYIRYGILSAAVLFLLPLLITNLDFIIQSYKDWYTELVIKNNANLNADNPYQNLSAIGLITRIAKPVMIPMTLIVIPAVILQLAPLVRFKNYSDIHFRLTFLSSLMLFIILYSTSTEASTHIIGAAGVGIWWLTKDQPFTNALLWFMLFVLILGTLSTTDLMPDYINMHFIRKYSLKALPYWMVWFACIYTMITKDYQTESIPVTS